MALGSPHQRGSCFSLAEPDERVLNREVAGEYNTLRVYLFMLRVGSSTPREVQQGLGFTSQTLAQYHLDKLKKYRLVEKTYDGTFHVKSRSFGILKFYVRSGRWIIPRTVFFTIAFGVLSAGFFFSLSEHIVFLLAFVVSLAGLAFSIYETIRFFRVLPA